MTVKPMTIESVLADWDGDEVELTLSTGQKVSGVISLAYDAQTVIIGVDTADETLYRTSAVIGARWVNSREVA